MSYFQTKKRLDKCKLLGTPIDSIDEKLLVSLENEIKNLKSIANFSEEELLQFLKNPSEDKHISLNGPKILFTGVEALSPENKLNEKSSVFYELKSPKQISTPSFDENPSLILIESDSPSTRVQGVQDKKDVTKYMIK